MGVGGRASFSDLSHIVPFSVLGIFIVNPVAAGSVHLIPSQNRLAFLCLGLGNLHLFWHRFSALSIGISAENFLSVQSTISSDIISIIPSCDPASMNI